MTTLISVTQDDIDHGVRQACDRCPIARAIGRVLAPKLAVKIARRTIDIGYPRVYKGSPELISQNVFGLTHQIVAFVNAFDKGEPVAPFSFSLDISDRLLAPPVSQPPARSMLDARPEVKYSVY